MREALLEPPDTAGKGCAGELLVAVLCVLNIAAALGFQGFAAIASSAAAWYEVPNRKINDLIVVAQATNLVSYVASSALVDRVSIEACLAAGTTLAMVGAWMRWLARGPGPELFSVALVGMGLSASATSFCGVLAAPVAAQHLRPSRRALGTSLIVLSNLLGIGAGQAVTGSFAQDIPLLMLIEAIAVSIPAIPALCYALWRMRGAGRDGAPRSSARSPYGPILRRMACNWPFVRLASGVGIVIGTFNTFFGLIEQVEPPALEGHAGMLTALIFGCGLIGAVAQGVLLGRTRAYKRVTRGAFCVLAPAWAAAATGWYCNVAGLVWAGFAVVGGFGVGLLPLAVDLGVELCYEPLPGFEGAVNGVVQGCTTAWGLACIYATEPSTIGSLVPKHRLIWLWSGLFAAGGALFVSATTGSLRRLAAERASDQALQGVCTSDAPA